MVRTEIDPAFLAHWARVVLEASDLCFPIVTYFVHANPQISSQAVVVEGVGAYEKHPPLVGVSERNERLVANNTDRSLLRFASWWQLRL